MNRARFRLATLLNVDDLDDLGPDSMTRAALQGLTCRDTLPSNVSLRPDHRTKTPPLAERRLQENRMPVRHR